ncbi:MAG: type II toxin-antitoxin system VapB family antitoxin [Propionibacteriaceae bacterium]|nr:type II toxin-antitoxin system VapB family antitoxin [Propionibacteriaceae bacterium]
MAINIKNERTVAAIKRLAARDGVSYTTAIEEAVNAALMTEPPCAEDAFVAEIKAIVDDYRAHGPGPLDTDELYDEFGLYR